MALVCREIAVADLPAVFELRFSTRENAVTPEELERDHGITPASLAAAMAGPVRGWLCEEQGRALGFAMGDRSSGEVLVVAVRPGAEGRGIGRRVLGAVCDWLFEAGWPEIWLRATPDPALRAHGFYRRLGWIVREAVAADEEIMVLARPAVRDHPGA